MQIYKTKSLCTGCGACANICPRQCIGLQPDEYGFIYPHVNIDLCINCNACKDVCHTYSTKKEEFAEQLFGFINSDAQVLEFSSSGGFFYHVAKKFIQRNGYVCGAMFDEKFNVHHEVTNNLEVVVAMCGSKYVQSDTLSVYSHIKKLLDQDVSVLFTGTPCQVIGLKKFLRREYDKLFTLDLICSSIPSPLIFQKYITEIEKKYGKIKKFSFRDKRNGWREYGVSAQCEKGEFYCYNKEDFFMKGFLGGIYSRESCTHCPAKETVGYCSDITIGDMWGAEEIMPSVDCKQGASALIVHTEKGYKLIENVEVISCDIEMLKRRNIRYYDSFIPYYDKHKFWNVFEKKGLDAAYRFIYNPSIFRKIRTKFCKK